MQQPTAKINSCCVIWPYVLMHKCILYGQNWISIVVVNMSQFLDLHISTISLFCDKLQPQAAISWVIRTFSHYSTDHCMFVDHTSDSSYWQKYSRKLCLGCKCALITVKTPAYTELWHSFLLDNFITKNSCNFHSNKDKIINLLMDCDEYFITWRPAGCFIKLKKIKSAPDKFYR